MRMAIGFTAAIFLIWVSTLGVRLVGSLSSNNGTVASGASGLVAAVGSAGSQISDQANQLQQGFASIEANNGDGSDTTATGTTTFEPSSAPATVLRAPSDSSYGQ